MINVNMTDKAGVTLATAGKYCADNVKVTPSADILRKDEQAKTATPTTSAQDITPDAGKALSKVTVNPITAAIVGDLDADSFASAIVAAIEGKGVTVPSGAKLDALAALIEAIEAGGMKTIFNHKFEYGSITPAEDITSDYTINFTIDDSSYIALPYYYFYLFHDSLNGTPNNSWLWLTFGRKASKAGYAYGQSISSNGSVSNQSYSSAIGSGASYRTECTVYCTTSKKLVAGEKYNWIKINVEEA